jgi:DNA replication protein DnaC
MVALCESATPKQEEFLLEVLQQELENRERSRRSRLLNRAKFPVFKSLEGYDFSDIRFPPALTKSQLTSCDFITQKTNLVCFGPVGTGKTHLAIALGVRSCEMGLKVKFFTVTELVLKLAEARKNGTLERLIAELKRLDLLILDEWGYVPVDKEGSQLLFRIISDSYESKSLILTTNLEFSKWGGIFTDQQMAAAMIDRLVHHGHLLLFEGQSYRMKHALMKKNSTPSPATGESHGRD